MSAVVPRISLQQRFRLGRFGVSSPRGGPLGQARRRFVRKVSPVVDRSTGSGYGTSRDKQRAATRATGAPASIPTFTRPPGVGERRLDLRPHVSPHQCDRPHAAGVLRRDGCDRQQAMPRSAVGLQVGGDPRQPEESVPAAQRRWRVVALLRQSPSPAYSLTLFEQAFTTDRETKRSVTWIRRTPPFREDRA
jgi:hypothetical protein